MSVSSKKLKAKVRDSISRMCKRKKEMQLMR